MSENNNFLQDKDINLDPNQDLSLLDREVKEVPHDVKEDDYILEVKNLKMYFPINISVFKTVPLKAVDEVSFKIRRGETFGLVGESGCGKTTLGRTILQLYQPTAGEVYFNGKQVKGKAALKEFRRKATIVFQDPYSSLDPRMTVSDIISEPLEIHNLYPNKKEREERVAELMEMVGLSREQASRYVHAFSGGQRQRIGIARALASSPEFIMCDEPVSALDVSIQAQILNTFQLLQKKLNLTYLFVAHNLLVVKHISDRIAVMYLGHIVELTTSEEIFKNPLHPYTISLLSAIPEPDPIKARNNQRQILEGNIPSPLKAPSGCPFRTRCPRASEKCVQHLPKLKEVSKGHLSLALSSKNEVRTRKESYKENLAKGSHNLNYKGGKNMKFRGNLFAVVAACMLVLPSCNAPAGSKSLVVCLASEPQSIDPALNSAVDGATLLVHLDSGLYRYQKKANNGGLELVYDLASNITKTKTSVVNHEPNEDGGWDAVTYPDGTRYTVTLRDGIKWSDGTAITSDDFIYSWNRASGAALGADYGYMFEAIADGLYHESDEDCTTLAMTKVSDTVFTFDVMVDVPYMDQLLAFPTYFPVQKKTVEENDTTEDGTWATNPSTYVSCGAYKMTAWEHNSYITLEKNPDYWDAANIKMDKITFALSDDDDAILASYKSGQYDMIDSVPNNQIDELKAAYPDEFVITGQMGTYYISFNMNSEVFTKATTEDDKAKVRKALGLFVDREYIVKEIGKAGQIPANAFVSAGLSDAAGGEFVDHNGPDGDGEGYYDKGETDEAYANNVAEGIALLKEVGYTYDETTKKFTDFPAFKYLYNTSTGHEAIAKNIRDTLDKYGITVTLENKDWATFLQVRKQGEYDVARNGWVADYDDPSSYLTMWTTNSGNNDCQYGKGTHASAAVYEADINRDGVIGADEKGLTWAQSYDKLIDLSNKEADANKRFKILHEAEDLLMSTGGICPIYYYTDIYMIKKDVKGFFSSPLGYKFFMYCTK